MDVRKLLRNVTLIVTLVISYANFCTSVIAAEYGKTGSDETAYKIKKGDTLWDISEEYLKNPFLWPNIWKENKYIKNPDLIYPGNQLVIPLITVPVLETSALKPSDNISGAAVPAAALPPTTEVLDSDSPSPSPSPLVQSPLSEASIPSPAMPPAPEVAAPVPEPLSPPLPLPLPSPPPVAWVELIEAGGYITDNIVSSGVIIGSPEEKNIFASGDDVNILLQIKGDKASPGDKFTIFSTPAYVSHPKTGKRVGMLFVPIGVLEITRVQGKDAAGKIIKSYSYSSTGDQIQPYKPASPVTEIIHPVPEVSGYIIGSYEGKVLNAEHGIVYLDKGASDGIISGTIFYVIGEEHGDITGELKIISVQTNTSTALVTHSREPFGVGSRVVTTTAR